MKVASAADALTAASIARARALLAELAVEHPLCAPVGALVASAGRVRSHSWWMGALRAQVGILLDLLDPQIAPLPVSEPDPSDVDGDDAAYRAARAATWAGFLDQLEVGS